MVRGVGGTSELTLAGEESVDSGCWRSGCSRRRATRWWRAGRNKVEEEEREGGESARGEGNGNKQKRTSSPIHWANVDHIDSD